MKTGTRPRNKATGSIYTLMKADIIHFDFKPGERLVELELSRRYGVSRTPVREALRRLEQEGLVSSKGNRGRFVPQFDVGRYENVYAVRIALEKLAVEEACRRAPDEEIAALRDTWEGEFRNTEIPLDGRYEAANQRFHAGLGRLSQNAYLVESLQRIRDFTSILVMMDFTTPERVAATRKEHGQLLDTIAARDVRKAQRLIEEHIQASKAHVRTLAAKALERIYLSEDDKPVYKLVSKNAKSRV
ncbi:MAG: GntR family transcriptional regulator [Casimicrobiaceae bacterium]